MKITRKHLKFYHKNWKMFVHLLLRTKRFGVNNKRWNDFDSPFGFSMIKIIWRVIRVYPLVEEFRMIKFRAVACHFMTDEEKDMMGWLEKAKGD
ncbi:MAG: hypothetical protein ABH951_01225 [Patescibacteria group bacterium]